MFHKGLFIRNGEYFTRQWLFTNIEVNAASNIKLLPLFEDLLTIPLVDNNRVTSVKH